MRASLIRSTLVAAAITLLAGSTALAIPPTRNVFSLNDTYTAVPREDFFNPCSEPLTVTFTGSGYTTDFYNQSGDRIRREFRSPRLTITVTGPNSNSLTGPSPAINFFYYSETSFTQMVSGLQIRFVIPGSGWVFLVTGRLKLHFDFVTEEFTVTFAGKSEVDLAAYCGYLGVAYRGA